MRSSLTPKAIAGYTALVALAAISACSDTSTAPSSLRPGNAAFTIGTTANVGPIQATFASNSSTQFCSAGTVIHGYAIPASYAPLAGCGTAFDLQTNLTTSYNPGWGAPITGSSWIGPNATSNEYRTAPGTYVFQTTFTMPAGVTNPVLNDTLRSDNAVAVYLNGFKVEQQTIADCSLAAKAAGTCNWQTSFVISDNNPAHFVTGTNTITVLLVDTPNGGTAANSYACTDPFQTFGELGFGTPFNVPTSPAHVLAGWTQTMTATTGCENPTGLDFHGTVSWVVPVTTWCSPGFWKNHEELWTPYLGVLYSSIGSWRAPLGNKAPTSGPGSNPTLQQVVENPQIYGGPATNSVADYLSHIFFGTPIGSGVESCPDPSDIHLPRA